MNGQIHKTPAAIGTDRTKLARFAGATLASLAAVVLISTSAVAQAPASPADSARVQAARVLSMFSHEPTVLATQDVASKHALNNPGVYSSWLSRAAAAFALPEQLRGRYVYILDDDLNVRSTDTTDAITSTRDNDLRNAIEVQIQWDLSKLVFNPEEYKAADKIGKIVERREDLLLSVNKLYFSRRRLQADVAMNPPHDAKTAIQKELAIAALTADLDALTGGWFTTEVAAGMARRKLSERRPAPVGGVVIKKK